MATDWIKTAAVGAFGGNFVRAAYRFIYTCISSVTFVIAYLLIKRLPDGILVEIPGYFKILFYLIQTFGAIIIILSFKDLGILEFSGVSQIVKYISGKEIGGNIEGLTIGSLTRAGVYGIIRHPLYAGGILVFLFNPNVTVNSAIVSLLSTIYVIIGAYIEDRRLKNIFGSQYDDYAKDIPSFIPKIFK
ncbi:MAG: isoprenylcysteine carboxylmethyltransferase family protein [Nitrospirae bacterium]|nr:isoprenylcysteine carboxylmethyltransferase family protein [Nitrospirota bacterium]